MSRDKLCFTAYFLKCCMVWSMVGLTLFMTLYANRLSFVAQTKLGVLKSFQGDNNVSLKSGYGSTGSKSILLLTYMRSGSSLTGDILQQANGTFYLYEPFRHIPESVVNTTYINGSISSTGNLNVQTEIQDAMFNWFTCEIQKISIGSFTDKFMKYGKKSKEVLECLSRMQYLPRMTRIQVCAEELRLDCLDSPVRIIKTIRTRFESVERLLHVLPNMKIVHLVRDPRATVFSRQSFPCLKNYEIFWCIQRYCDYMKKDVIARDRLLKKYPGRIKTFFYEDIALHPLKASEKLYDFIGEELTGSARDYIYNITSAGIKNGCSICSSRSNSTKHIYTWRHKMNASLVNLVQKHCEYVLDLYNYEKM